MPIISEKELQNLSKSDALLSLLLDLSNNKCSETPKKGWSAKNITEKLMESASREHEDFCEGRQQDAIRKDVERRLKKLVERELVVSWANGRSTLYALNKDASIFDLFLLAKEKILASVLPRSFVFALDNLAHDAEDTECRSHQRAMNDTLFKNMQYQQWVRKIRRLNSNIMGQRQYALDDERGKDVFIAICNALFWEKKLKIKYCSKSSDYASEKYKYVSPLGLVFFQSESYLICKFGGSHFNDVRKLAVSRFWEVEVSEYPISEKCHDFDLDTYIEGGYFQFSDQVYPLAGGKNLRAVKRERVILKCHSDSTFDRILEMFDAPHLGDEENSIQVETVISYELVKWLLSQHGLVEVLAPIQLRKEIKNYLTNALARYQ